MRSSFATKVGFALVLLFCAASASAQSPTAAPDEDLVAAKRLLRQGSFPEAAKAFRKIIATAPSAAAYAGLIQTLLKHDDVAAADTVSGAAVQTFADSAVALAARGDVLFRRGLLPEAHTAYSSALVVDKKCARAWLGQGKIDAALAHRRRALQEITAAHDLDPEDGDAFYEWATRQAYPGNIAWLEKHLSEFRSDPETEGHERDYLALLKALAGRNVWILQAGVERAQLKLEPLTAGPNLAVRGYGLRVKFNARASATLLLDTGSSGVTVTRKFAEKIGARKLSDQKIEGVGKNGGARGYQAWVDEISIGDLEFHDCFVHVVPGFATDTDGLIGTDVFDRFLIGIDFPSRRLNLEPLPSAPADDGAASDDLRSSAKAFAFGHLLLLRVQLEEKPSGLFVLDSGANMTTVSPDASKQVRQMRTFNAPVRGTSGVVNSAQIADGVSIRFARAHRKDRIITVELRAISKDIGTEISGQLGFNTLEGLRIAINYRDGVIDFGYNP